MWLIEITFQIGDDANTAAFTNVSAPDKEQAYYWAQTICQQIGMKACVISGFNSETKESFVW